jgi:hypothetical protein
MTENEVFRKIDKIFKNCYGLITGEEGLNYLLLSMKNNLNLKNKLINFEKDSDVESKFLFIKLDLQNYLSIFSTFPTLRNTLLEKTLKNFKDINRYLTETYTGMKNELLEVEKLILTNTSLKSDIINAFEGREDDGIHFQNFNEIIEVGKIYSKYNQMYVIY